MKDLPPPPEPAFANWCAEQITPPALCARLHPSPLDGPTLSLEMWGWLILAAFFFCVLIAYLFWFSRRAYLGGRFCDALDGYDNAARFADHLDELNESNLGRGIRALAVLEPNRVRR